MAHEIRTPLHQVTGFIDLLHDTDLNEEQQSFVKVLKSSAQGLMTVINDVLDYSKLEAGKMKFESIPYEPRSVLEESMEASRAICEDTDLYLNSNCSKMIPSQVMGDPNRSRQVVRISTGIPGKLMENCTDKPARQLSDNTNDVASASTQKG